MGFGEEYAAGRRGSHEHTGTDGWLAGKRAANNHKMINEGLSASGSSSAKGGGFILLCLVVAGIYNFANSGSSATPASSPSPSQADTRYTWTPPPIPVDTISKADTSVKPSPELWKQQTEISPTEKRGFVSHISDAPATPDPTRSISTSASTEPAETASDISNYFKLEPWPAEGRRYEAERKGFDNDCKVGTLTLESSGIHYECEGDASKGFSAALADIQLDGDGIKVVSKGNRTEKYHFKIPEVGNDKTSVNHLFEDWIKRTSQSAGLK